MSADADADQTLRLRRREVLVLGGALNVATEALERPGFDTSQYPVTRGQIPLFQKLRARLIRRMQRSEGFEPAVVQDVLTPEEAQAVRDAAGLLETLLQDAGGRAILAEIGFLASPDQDVDEDEIDVLMNIQQMLDPTGARPERTRPARATGEVIDPTLSLEQVIVTAAGEIGQATLPWPGFEQVNDSLRETIAQFGGGETTLGCESILKTLVAVTKQAVAAHRRRSDRNAIANLHRLVDDTYTALLSSIETKHCVGRNGEATLDARFDDVVDAIREDRDVTDAAQQLLTDLRAVAEPPEDFTGGPDPLERASQAQRDIRIGREDPDDVVAELRHIEDQVFQGVDCDEAFIALIDATHAAIHVDTHATVNGLENVQNGLESVYAAINNALAARDCLTDGDDFNRMRTLTDQVVNSIGGDPRGFARTLYNWVEEVLEAGTGLAAVEGREGFESSRREGPGNARLRVEQLRAELPDVLEFTQTEETVRDAIVSILPSPPTDCDQLLVALAELAQLDAQVVASTAGRETRTGAGIQGDRELIEIVQDARRRVMSMMGEAGCLDESRPIREAFLAIHDPLEDDPEDVETRAFAAISDIRQALLNA